MYATTCGFVSYGKWQKRQFDCDSCAAYSGICYCSATTLKSANLSSKMTVG